MKIRVVAIYAVLFNICCAHASSLQTNIVVVGAGYVGLVTGACFAQQSSNNVIIVEKDAQKVQTLLTGRAPFVEPRLDVLVSDGIRTGRLHFSSSIADACALVNPDVIFLCVGTPSNEDGSADLSYVYQAAQEIGSVLRTYCVVVDKSTVPVGTARTVKKIIQDCLAQRGINLVFDVASNPEFLQEGSAVKNFIEPDRIVVGVESQQAANTFQALYAPFLAKKAPLLAMSLESAELTKYAANAMLATRISFMNELTLLASATGADIEHIKWGIAADKRIGPYFLNPGVGYGGSCFPKDVKALVAMGRDHGIPMALVHEVDAVNNRQRSYFLDMILNYYGSDITHKTIGVWGLSFKPETDDIRNAPSIDIIAGLLARGASVVVYDPVAEANVHGVFADAIKYAGSADQILQQCDSLVVLTEWREFVAHKPGAFLTLTDRVVFDGRNCFDPRAMAHGGIRYFTVGRNCYQCQNQGSFF